MHNRSIKYCFGLVLSISCLVMICGPEWGFFGHRKINRMAVYTLPQDLIPLFKENIEFVTEHSVDPDKRKFATKREAARHYIDIDHWGKPPFDNLPRTFYDALTAFSSISIGFNDEETLIWDHLKLKETEIRLGEKNIETGLFLESIEPLVAEAYFEDEWKIKCEEIERLLNIDINNCDYIVIVDSLSQFGILPYHLQKTKLNLQRAFELRDVDRVLQLAADLGHYIGDAHVPLHTAENYNGQKTDQVGIHAFWESRIPELFADERFDFFVGQADYIYDTQNYFWEIILDSHELVDSVLLIEKRLSKKFPSDLQYCYDERLGRTTKTYCKEYAEAYDKAMGGMVEKRMTEAIKAVGDIWYTCWVDAGQPDVRQFGDFEISDSLKREFKILEEFFQGGELLGRDHEN